MLVCQELTQAISSNPKLGEDMLGRDSHDLPASFRFVTADGSYPMPQALTNNYGVRLFRPNNVLRLNWRSNHSHRAGHDSSFATNPFRKHRLVTGTHWNCRVRHIATGRTVDEIDAYLL